MLIVFKTLIYVLVLSKVELNVYCSMFSMYIHIATLWCVAFLRREASSHKGRGVRAGGRQKDRQAHPNGRRRMERSDVRTLPGRGALAVFFSFFFLFFLTTDSRTRERTRT